MSHDDISREHLTESAAPAPNPDRAPDRDGGPTARNPDPDREGGSSAQTAEAIPEAAAPEAVSSNPAAWSISVPAQAAPLKGDGPILVPPSPQRRGRKWARRVEDLPRSERWKRRLPEVCR